MPVWVYALVSVVAISLISLAGVFFLSVNRDTLQRILFFLVSFAIGGLIGDAFIHLIPDSFDRLGLNLTTSLLVMAGFFIFFTLEKALRTRQCFIPESRPHLHPVVTLNLSGDAVHNFIDGILIGATYLVSIPIGITTAIAIMFHEVPQEIGDFAILVFGGMKVKRALLFNFGTALMAVLGTVVSLLAGPYLEAFTPMVLPITAGGFIYIAAADLIPELQEKCEGFWLNVGQFAGIALGIGVMALLSLIE